MKTKICIQCGINKSITDFTFRKDSNTYRNHCKKCRSENQAEYFENNKEKHYSSIKKYYTDNPWMQSFRAIQWRCNNPNVSDYKYYGEKGIRNYLSKEDIKFLWFRDKAYEMKKPTIDRENSNKHYILENCRFMEQSENSIRMNLEKNVKSISQYDLDGNFIKEFISVAEAGRYINTSRSNINGVLKNRQKTAKGFIWKYKNN